MLEIRRFLRPSTIHIPEFSDMRRSFTFAITALVVALTTASVFAQTPAADPTPALIEKLSTATGAEKLAAIDALADHGAHAAAATAELAKLLSDGDEAVRIRAAKALGAIGPGAAGAVDTLAAALADASPKVRAYELFALGRIGEKARSAFPKVAEQLTNEDVQVRREAVKAIRQMHLPLDTTVPVLVKVFETAKSTEEVMPALHAMSEVGKAGVPKLVEAMQKYPQARYWICRILAEMGADAAEAVPAVVEVLGDPMTDIRREAVLCLGHIGKPAVSAAPQLLSLLSDKDSGTRAAAIWALMMVDSSPAEVLVGVKPLVADADPMVGLVAAWSVAKLEPSDAAHRRAALDRFIGALKDKNPRMRAAAARAIVDLKSGDEAAREALIASLADGDATVAMIVNQALVEAGEQALPLLIKGLERPEIRGFVVQTLGQLGAKAKPAATPLAALLADENPHIRAAVLIALAHIAPTDPDVIAKLVAGLADKNMDVRLAAIHALTGNTAAAAAAKPELEKLLNDPNSTVRDAARFAIEAKKAE